MYLINTLLTVAFIFSNYSFAKDTCSGKLSEDAHLFTTAEAEVSRVVGKTLDSFKGSKLNGKDAFEIAKKYAIYDRIINDTKNSAPKLEAVLTYNPYIKLYILTNHLGFKLPSDEEEIFIRNGIETLILDETNPTDIKTIADLDEAISYTIEKITDKIDPRQPLKDRFWDRLKQFVKFPSAFKKLKTTAKEEYSPTRMDENLFSHYGFHHMTEVPYFQARDWELTEQANITPSQVLIDPVEFIRYVLVSMEIEDPIEDYSRQSGQSLRFLLPTLARFMGSPRERYAYLDANNNPHYCESAWCVEENRHGNAWAQIYERLTGIAPDRSNPNEVDELLDTVDDSFKHLMSRMTTEWNASSTYLNIAAWSEGELHNVIVDMMRDEIKHLSIASGAYIYLRGPTFNQRLIDMLKVAVGFLTYHQDARSTGSGMTNNKLSVVEFLYASWMAEMYTRRYLKTIPLRTLRMVFDTGTKLEVKEVLAEDETLERFERWELENEQRRKALSWWRPKAAEAALRQERFELIYKSEIRDLISEEFDRFKGAELYVSMRAEEFRTKIERFDFDLTRYVSDARVYRDRKLWKKILYDALRHYQIVNNAYVLKQRELGNELVDGLLDDIIARDRDPGEVRVLETVKVTNDYSLVRLERPQGIELKKGMAFVFQIPGELGKQKRMLSLASDPSANYVEFAVTDSDSAFKRMFRSLNPGDSVILEDAKMALDFDFSQPSLFISTGIGITPFRSALQEAARVKSHEPIHLLFGNRTDIPFKDEFDALEGKNFNVSYILSKPRENWYGSSGRINTLLISDALQDLPSNTQIYIVGNPKMVLSVEESLKNNLLVDPNRIHIETFNENNASSVSPSLASKRDRNNVADL